MMVSPVVRETIDKMSSVSREDSGQRKLFHSSLLCPKLSKIFEVWWFILLKIEAHCSTCRKTIK
jgi:hypothetical protein